MITRIRRAIVFTLMIALVMPLAFPASPSAAVIPVAQSAANTTSDLAAPPTESGELSLEMSNLSPTALVVSQTLAVSSNDFAAGRFGLTGLAANGGVQLVPLGVLRRWQTNPEQLCRNLGNMGTATFGQYIYLVGGATSFNNTTISHLAEVCRTKVTGANAETTPWTTVASENMPAKRRSLATVAVPQGTNPANGYLYAFGGTQENSNDQKNTIFRATIDGSTGALANWVTLPITLPSARQGMSIASFKTDGGKTFIYVIGGFRQLFGSVAMREVVRYEVLADGNLSVGQQVTPVPIPDGVVPNTEDCAEMVGIKDTTAVTLEMPTESGVRSILAVMGGIFQLGTSQAVSPCLAGTAISARVFVAEINPVTGDLTWQPDDYTLPEPISQMTAIGVNGKIYGTGGLIGDQSNSTNNTYTTYVRVNDLKLENYQSSNFLVSETAMSPDQRRGSHGMVLVEVPTPGEPFPTRPILFVFGGTNTLGGYRQDVLYGFVGLPSDTDIEGDYAYLGTYASPVYTLRGSGAVTELRWNATLASSDVFTTDLKMHYRVAATSSELSSANWIPLDGDPGSGFWSKNGLNIGTSTAPDQGRVLQFMAMLSTNKRDERQATPVLRGAITVKYTVDGHPSLYVKSGSFPTIVAGQTATADIRISNSRPPASTRTENVLDADLEASGSFYVDLYAFPPGVTPVMPTKDPATGAYPLTSVAYAEVARSAMTAGTEIVVPPGTWKVNCGPPWICPAANWNVIFNRSGTWNVIAIVDSQNNVTEADTFQGEWENDNALTFTVTSNVQGTVNHWPIGMRNGVTGRPEVVPTDTRRPPSPEFLQP